MPDADQGPMFPTNDALCERCGYPLRGLAIDAVCPECGLAVVESSPAMRGDELFILQSWVFDSMTLAVVLFFRPRSAFRGMPISGSNAHPRLFLFAIVIGATLMWYLSTPQLVNITPNPNYRTYAA